MRAARDLASTNRGPRTPSNRASRSAASAPASHQAPSSRAAQLDLLLVGARRSQLGAVATPPANARSAHANRLAARRRRGRAALPRPAARRGRRLVDRARDRRRSTWRAPQRRGWAASDAAPAGGACQASRRQPANTVKPGQTRAQRGGYVGTGTSAGITAAGRRWRRRGARGKRWRAAQPAERAPTRMATKDVHMRVPTAGAARAAWDPERRLRRQVTRSRCRGSRCCCTCGWPGCRCRAPSAPA
jgi:hypothetical protein